MAADDEGLPELGEAMNRVGAAALAVAGDDDARVLIYGEFGAEIEHVIFRYGPAGGAALHCADDIEEVMDALRDAWEIARARGGRYQWRAVIYRIERRRMDVKLLYDGEVDEDLSMYDKEDRLLATYYPGIEVVPVAPDPPASAPRAPSPPRPFWKFWR